MMSLVLAMVLYPEWQKKMQSDIDGIVGDTPILIIFHVSRS